MKNTLYLFAFVLLASCMSAAKHYEKAIEKGHVPEKETIEVERLEILHTIDSVTNEIVHTDTFIVREKRTIYQDRPATKIELRMQRDSLNHLKRQFDNELKKEKESHQKDIKLAKIESKRLEMKLRAYKEYVKIKTKPKKTWLYWIKWLLISFVFGFISALFRKQILKLLLKIPLPFK